MGKGGLTVQKPSRSDEVLEAQQQWQIAAQIKSHFESLAPKRHRKPIRSEGSDDDQDVAEAEDDPCDDIPPELKKYQELKSHSGSLIVCENGESLPEEFVETDYYKDLNAVDKLHHPPGVAFIKLEYDDGSYFRLAYQEETGLMERIPVRCNPATNDWIPAPVDDQETMVAVSSKPIRSG
jgi:hypothetical protein